MIIVVYGAPGTGKSTIGKALSERLSYDFIDQDNEIPDEMMRYIVSNEVIPDDVLIPSVETLVEKTKELAGKTNVVLSAIIVKDVTRPLFLELPDLLLYKT